jgi:hypothetical protein
VLEEKAKMNRAKKRQKCKEELAIEKQLLETSLAETALAEKSCKEVERRRAMIEAADGADPKKRGKDRVEVLGEKIASVDKSAQTLKVGQFRRTHPI